MKTNLRIFIWITFFICTIGSLVYGWQHHGKDMLPRGRAAVNGAHARHDAASVSCSRCHKRAKNSAWASHRLIPSMNDCVPCHEEARNANVLNSDLSVCRKCHIGTAGKAIRYRGVYPRPNMRFSHKAHNKQNCVFCHKETLNGRDDVFNMKFCWDCHDKDDTASTRCGNCHLAHGDGRMVTQLGDRRLTPPDWLKGPTHGADWAGNHAPIAGADSQYCGNCHRETFCQGCHSGRLRPRNIHPGDWLSSHGVNTRMDNPNCMGCHRMQTFCISCHRRSGVAPDAPTSTRPPNSGNYHGNKTPAQICRRARHDIGACVSCHSESSCIRCHGAVNPHPVGWSKRCKRLRAQNSRSCTKCHGNELQHLCR